MIRFVASSEYDLIDAQIMDALEKNCKATYKDIAEYVNLSIPRVYERIKKLEEKGFIKGYHAEIDFQRLGYAIHAFVLVRPDKYVGKMTEQLKQIECVHDLWLVSGEYDYLLEVYTKDANELNALVNDLYNMIGRTRTLLVMKH